MNSSNFGGIDLFQFAIYIAFYLLGHWRGRKTERACHAPPPSGNNGDVTGVPPQQLGSWFATHAPQPRLSYCRDYATGLYGWAGYGKSGDGHATLAAAAIHAHATTGMKS